MNPPIVRYTSPQTTRAFVRWCFHCDENEASSMIVLPDGAMLGCCADVQCKATERWQISQWDCELLTMGE